MENQTPVEQPVTQAPIGGMSMSPHPQSNFGAVIGTIIIIGLIVIGGLYFWGKRIEDRQEKQTILETMNKNSEVATQQEAAAIQSVSSSDDISSLRADMQATTVTNLDSGL